MSRRQSEPQNMFLRAADPLPPLFPEPNIGDYYYNTTYDVVRIYKKVAYSDPVRYAWQDLTAGGADEVGKDRTWTIVGPDDPGDPTRLTNPTKNLPIWIDTDDGGDESGGDGGGGGGPDTTWTIVGPDNPGDPSNLPNPRGGQNSPIWIDTSVDGGDESGGGGGGLDQTTADGRYVNITGDTMTGALTVNADLTVAGSYIDIEGTNGSFYTASSRVGIEAYNSKEIRLLTDGYLSLEGGRVFLASDQPIWIQNAGGTSTQQLTNLSAPTSANDATNKAYVDARTPNMLVLGPTDPVPDGTPAGTVVVRTET